VRPVDHASKFVGWVEFFTSLNKSVDAMRRWVSQPLDPTCRYGVFVTPLRRRAVDGVLTGLFSSAAFDTRNS